MHVWYGHPYVTTLVIDLPMEAGAENDTPVERRGSSTVGIEPTTLDTSVKLLLLPRAAACSWEFPLTSCGPRVLHPNHRLVHL